MINYKLAQKLKDAGFRDEEGMDYYCQHLLGRSICTHCTKTSFIAFPTLSELIEACGDDFETRFWKTEDGRFRVITNLDDGQGNELDFWLPSLEEAFAYIWLHRDKKNGQIKSRIQKAT